MNIVKLATCGAILGAAMLLFVGGASAQSAFFSSSYDAVQNIGKTAPTALTTIVADTTPTTGCPCRAVVSYFVPVRSGGTRGILEAWVNDGTNNFAATSQTFTINTNSALEASDVSPVTYGNSQSVTFTLNAQGQTPVNKAEVASPVTAVTNYFKVYFVPDISPVG